MTVFEKRSIALVAYVLYRELGFGTDRQKMMSGYRKVKCVKPERVGTYDFDVKKISWSGIDIYFSRDGYHVINEGNFSIKDAWIVTDERPYERIRIFEFYPSGFKGSTTRHQFEVEIYGERIKITDQETGGKENIYEIIK